MASQLDISLATSPIRTDNIRILLLDTDFIPIEEIQGKATSASLTISAPAEIRRSCSILMYVPNKTYLTSSASNIWLNRAVRVYYQIWNPDIEAYVEYLLGTFLMKSTSYRYDESTQELQLSLVDMMSALREERGSQIGGSPTFIPYGSNVRSAIIATVAKYTKFSFFDVPEFPDVIPYDLEFDIGVYPYEILRTILSLFPTYQHFYSPEGVYVVSEIPTGISDTVFADASVMDSLLIGESRSNDFSGVRNITEVWGMELDAGYTASSCTTSSDKYVLAFSPNLATMEENATFSFSPSSNSASSQKIQIDELEPYPVYVKRGDDTEVVLPVGGMLSGRYYVVKYQSGKFYLQGESLVRAICMEVSRERTPAEKIEDQNNNYCLDIVYVVNPDSPFSVDKIGEVRRVLRGGEYDAIHTNELAKERAKYENWKTTRLQDSVTISSIIVPWLDVNKKIEYSPPMLRAVPQGSLFVDEAGDLLSTVTELEDYIKFKIDSSGNLIMSDDTAETTYEDIGFSVSESGDFIVDNVDSPMTYLTQEITFSFSSGTMDITAQHFYPYYPW